MLAESLRGWWPPDRLTAAQVRRGFNWPFYDAFRDGVIRLRLPGFPGWSSPWRSCSAGRRYRLSLIVTENGVAVAEGIPVQGYFHWSLLNNFKWTHG
ncbi:hypothetical protein [Synechococcus sp. GFB01]|uniref:hypothetical protein n=1 Tax=Synechococcus sp. GFB01 TaxID=1662190 RepID=UPI00064EB27C|nr:hypothetical protein [Synechococcus sp. GFB01]KMM16745.1 hypothetical protein SYNGFB01_08995 [Synechococcus sp. GFB01]